MSRSKAMTRHSERGVALVLAIFTLMLISVIGTALILMAGTQTAIKTNYKSSMQAFYDAKAGLEEGRSRLWAGNANPLNACVFPTPGLPMPGNNVCYIINPDTTSNETVDPTDPANAYYDDEYRTEFPAGAPVVQPFVNSKSQVTVNNKDIHGPLYKWVRVTPVTERSAGIDVDGDGLDDAPLFFDGKHTSSSGTAQVLAVTALAVTSNGSRRLVQSNVAQPLFGTLAFPAAVTLDGNGVRFQGPANGGFYVNGNDGAAPSDPNAGVTAVGYTNSSDSAGISPTPTGHYESPPSNPSVGVIADTSLPDILKTPSGLDALVQSITASADKVVTGPVTVGNSDTVMPSGMSPSNPMVVVVNGDLTFNNWRNTGYGVLLVTGQLNYDPDASWNGIILVIGKGAFVATGNGQSGHGRINGTVFIAQTRDGSGRLLPDLGPASFSQTGGGDGIYYNSAVVKAAQARLSYQVVSFREIQQRQP